MIKYNNYNSYVKNQINTMVKALSKSHCHCEAEDYAFEFLSRARKNPSVSKIVEHNVLKSEPYSNYLSWKGYKSAWYDASDNVEANFEKKYPKTGEIRKLLIKNDRILLDKTTLKMQQEQKTILKDTLKQEFKQNYVDKNKVFANKTKRNYYPKTFDLRVKLILHDRFNIDFVKPKMSKLQKILFMLKK